MKAALKDLLFYPDTFFKNIAQEKVNLIPPLIIVAGGCALSLSGIIYCPLYFGKPFDLTSISPMIVYYVLWPFFDWVLVSGVIYLFSRLFSNAGSLFATLQNEGYGMLPWVISYFISVVPMTLLYEKSHFYTSFWCSPWTISAIMFYAALFWSCCLWVYAIKHTCQIPLRKATVVVVIAIMAYFLTIYLKAYIPGAF
jgi:hypothetical protein